MEGHTYEERQKSHADHRGQSVQYSEHDHQPNPSDSPASKEVLRFQMIAFVKNLEPSHV